MPTRPPDPEADEFEAFAVCLPGLEPWLAEELRAIGVREPEPLRGGVGFRGHLRALYRANLESGLASHVLVRVAEFGARSLADLDHRGSRIDWNAWLRPGTPYVVKAACRRSRIYHSGAAAERIERHLRERVGVAPEATSGEGEDDPVVIRVRIQDNRCTVSVDSSGSPLHRRGWRIDPGPAPLRADLACALLMASRWDRQCPLVDPMMGSGTIPIEAAGIARRLAPGRHRSFAIERLALHDAALLDEVTRAAADCALPGARGRIVGSDRDANAVHTARGNAERAGVLADLELGPATLTESLEAFVDQPGPGVIATNPPYGRRLDDAATLPNLYRGFGDAVRRLPAGWIVAFVAADRRLAHRTGLELETAFLADSGGLKIRAMRTKAPVRGSASGTEPPSSGP